MKFTKILKWCTFTSFGVCLFFLILFLISNLLSNPYTSLFAILFGFLLVVFVVFLGFTLASYQSNKAQKLFNKFLEENPEDKNKTGMQILKEKIGSRAYILLLIIIVWIIFCDIFVYILIMIFESVGLEITIWFFIFYFTVFLGVLFLLFLLLIRSAINYIIKK